MLAISVKEKNKTGRGGKVAVLNRLAGNSSVGNCYLNLSLEVESMNQSRTWTTSIPGRGNSKCKGAGQEHD